MTIKSHIIQKLDYYIHALLAYIIVCGRDIMRTLQIPDRPNPHMNDAGNGSGWMGGWVLRVNMYTRMCTVFASC